VGKPRCRWENAVRKYAADLHQMRQWKVAAGNTPCYRRNIGDAMSRKWAAALEKKGKYVVLHYQIYAFMR
jgi:hypothetical protein